ncbi:HPr family phosphocarrier protein [Eubacterium sp. 1001713B170207_170306_E7]|uniref:HPr family phosphocarrier protein n=1 Tax=Eubacterium sp. 1001713B170207_170306_E7 TaxID=2787097 RepID=UPI001896D0C4|nr:HPr family phosphocarrier protein [Eubacterium sp. 1001713B170207_170306_E7]
MKEFNYTITDPAGIHARPAGLLVKKTQPYSSEISLVKDGKTGNGKSMLSVMGLGAKNGETITVQADGPDEDTAIAELEAFFKENL